MDHSITKRWLTRLVALVGIVALSASTASARILFQNDEEFKMDADNLVIDSNGDTDADEIYIKFGNGVGGQITWDLLNSRFNIADDVNISGDLTLTGQVNASTAAGFRIREVPDVVNGVSGTNCTTPNEIALDTGEGAIYMCTDAAPANVWIKATASASVTAAAADPATPCTVGALFYNTTAAELKYCAGASWETVGPQDFEQVFATDADKTLTTGNQAFTINTGSAALNFDAGVFDIDATTFDLTATTVNVTGNVDINSTNWDITAAGAATFDSTTTGNLTADGVVDFSGAASVQVREVGTIVGADCTVAGEIVLDTSSSKLYVCTDAGANTWQAQDGGKSELLVIQPEFPNAIIQESGSNNKGTLTSALASGRKFYNWVSTRNSLQDISIIFTMTLPADFKELGDFTLAFQTNSGTAANNNVDLVSIRDVTIPGTPDDCSVSDLGNASATWADIVIDGGDIEAGCASLAPGSVLEFTVNLATINAGNFARVGQAQLDYTN